MGGVERNISGQSSGDRNGNTEISRMFVVTGATPGQIQAMPESVTLDDGSTLPAYGSVFEGARLDRLEVSPAESGIVNVVARYSKSGRFRLTAPVPITPDVTNYRRGGSTAVFTDTLPYAVKSSSTFNFGGTDVRVPMWKVLEAGIISGAMRFSATVQIQAGDVASANYAITQQVGIVHEIPVYTDGVWARFEGADYMETEPDKFAFTYSWTVDFGIAWTAEQFTSTADVEYPRRKDPATGAVLDEYFESPYVNGKFVRPPYCKIVSSAHPLDDRQPPIWTAIQCNRFDDQGWAALPGMMP